jgi:transcriptional regulator with XRE-family HTH domain
MFNMQHIGQKISELRKSQNMTQMELADKMNISFQAVSNWERGNSMPDISKLPELAGLFGISIDALLGERFDLLESVLNNQTGDYLQENTVTVNEFKKIVPILKPKQVDEIFENANPPFVLTEIAEILPFISQDIISQLASKCAENNNFNELDVIAPFIDSETIHIIARKIISAGKSIIEIAPFLNKEMVTEIAFTSYEKKGLEALEDIAPFIPSDVIQKISEQEFETHGLKYFEAIAPFLDSAYLTELARKAISKDGIKAISPIAPFLDKKMLSEFVKENFL